MHVFSLLSTCSLTQTLKLSFSKRLASKVCLTFSAILLANNVWADTLMEIFDLAKRNDPQIKAAKSTLESAREYINLSDANFLPSLDFNTGYNYSDTFNGVPLTTDKSYTSYGLSLSVPIYNYSNFTTSNSNEAYVAQSEAKYKAAELDLMVRVADRYFAVLSAFDNLEFTKAEKEAIARQLDQTKQRFDVGLVAITDVHEAQARFDSSTAETIAAESALDNALESLRELTASYPKELSGLKENTPLLTPDPNDIDEWTTAALKQNLSIIATQYGVDQSRENIKAQRAGYHPTINASASVSGNDRPDSESYTNASINLRWNIWAGGRTNAAVRQANYDLTTALENLEKTRRDVQRQVRDAFLQVKSGISRVKALKQAVISSESAMKASEAGFEVGTRTTVDVLLARQNLFSARRNLSQATYQYITDTLRLKSAAGQLMPDDLVKINQWLQ